MCYFCCQGRVFLLIALSLDLAACTCTRFRFRPDGAQNEVGAHAYIHTCIEACLQRDRHTVLYRMCPACSCCPRAYTNARSDQLAKTHIAESMNTCIDTDAAGDQSENLRRRSVVQRSLTSRWPTYFGNAVTSKCLTEGVCSRCQCGALPVRWFFCISDALTSCILFQDRVHCLRMHAKRLRVNAKT